MTEWKDYIARLAKRITLVVAALVCFIGLVLGVGGILWLIIYGISTHNLEERINEDRQNTLDYGSVK